MEYIENVNVSTIIERRDGHVKAKAELESRLSRMLQEVEQTKNNIHVYQGAISACDDILTTAESEEVEIPELQGLESEKKN